METTISFDPKPYFPPRRRALQACATCRTRKTRCDGKSPKCALCLELDVDCVYFDTPPPKIDTNTRVLLDRIQQLEDLILSLPSLGLSSPKATKSSDGSQLPNLDFSSDSLFESPQRSFATSLAQVGKNTLPEYYGDSMSGGTPSDTDGNLLTLPIAHTATANHVYRWPVLQSILARVSTPTRFSWSKSFPPSLLDATDIFFLKSSWPLAQDLHESWHLFQDDRSKMASSRLRKIPSNVDSQVDMYRVLIEEYFLNVHVFYSILRRDYIFSTLSSIVKVECYQQLPQDSVLKSQYCLLLLVICLGAWAKSDKSLICLSSFERSAARRYYATDETLQMDTFDYETVGIRCWQKATLLLGSMITEDELEAAQCYALASIFMGARGRVLDSHHYMRAAATKCEIIAKRSTLKDSKSPHFSDSFRRLFWIVYVYESDFLSEFSITLPSGIIRFEEVVPYPTSEHIQVDDDTEMASEGDDSSVSPDFQRGLSSIAGNTRNNLSPHLDINHSNLAAFQISTYSAIRRFFNRVNAVVYDQNEAWRKKNHNTYITWLLKVSQELGNHQEAIHRNVPSFLLANDPSTEENGEDSTSGSHRRRFANHLWNVSRLKGRYCAGQFVINRVFVEYVLLNPTQFEIHPSRMEILEKCKICIDGCSGFVQIFSTDQINCTTNLFATGMATFTMVIILMISTACPRLHSILSTNIEDVISVGLKNLRHFSRSIKEFEWHVQELERLDDARKMGAV